MDQVIAMPAFDEVAAFAPEQPVRASRIAIVSIQGVARGAAIDGVVP